MSDMGIHELSGGERLRLAERLGGTPAGAIAGHALRHDVARAWATGPAGENRDASVVQLAHMPAEPLGFGEDAAEIAAILRHVPDWGCVELTRSCAEGVAARVEAMTGCSTRLYGGVGLALRRPAAVHGHRDVRLLTEADIPAWRRADPAVRQCGFRDETGLLREGFAAGAFDGERLVSIVQTSAVTARWVDLGTVTLAPYRRRGYSTAAASLVARQVQASGRIPIWSTGEGNDASLRVAEKVGFEAAWRSCYVIPEKDAEGRKKGWDRI